MDELFIFLVIALTIFGGGIFISRYWLGRKNRQLQELMTDIYFENQALRLRVQELEFLVAKREKS